MSSSEETGAPADLPPGTFLASFPWWVAAIAHGPSAAPGFLVIDAADGSTCLAVFTDDDLARRFVDASGKAAVPTAVPRPRDFAALTRLLPPVCTHVAFDPPATVGGRARWVVTLAYLMNALDLVHPDEQVRQTCTDD